MRISDWSSDVCSSDLLWKRIADAKATVRHNVKVEWVRAHQNTGSLNDKVDALVNKCARTQEACNGPSLQDGTAQATGTIISDMAGATIGPPPAATKPVEPHDVVDRKSTRLNSST